MLVRTISSVVFLLIILPCIYFSSTPLFIALAVFLSLASVFEMLKCNGVKNKVALAIPMYLIAIFPILARYLSTELFYKLIFPIIFVLSFVVMTVYTFLKDKPDLGKVILTWFISCFVPFASVFVATKMLSTMRDCADKRGITLFKKAKYSTVRVALIVLAVIFPILPINVVGLALLQRYANIIYQSEKDVKKVETLI